MTSLVSQQLPICCQYRGCPGSKAYRSAAFLDRFEYETLFFFLKLHTHLPAEPDTCALQEAGVVHWFEMDWKLGDTRRSMSQSLSKNSTAKLSRGKFSLKSCGVGKVESWVGPSFSSHPARRERIICAPRWNTSSPGVSFWSKPATVATCSIFFMTWSKIRSGCAAFKIPFSSQLASSIVVSR